MTVIKLTESTWSEIAASAPDAIALLPIGSQEQHAGHLPLGTDTTLANAVIDTALEAFADSAGGGGPTIVRLPMLPFGHSPHHLFRAAVSLRAETFLEVLRDILDSLHSSGFRRVLIVNGHGGNTEVLSLAVKEFALRAPIVAATCNYWDLAPDTDEPGENGAEDPGSTPGHAGRFETSLMLAVRPDLVALETADTAPDELPLFDRHVHTGLTIAPNGEWERAGGLTDDPTLADATRGAVLIRRRARGLSEAVHAFDEATRSWTGTK